MNLKFKVVGFVKAFFKTDLFFYNNDGYNK